MSNEKRTPGEYEDIYSSSEGVKSKSKSPGKKKSNTKKKNGKHSKEIAISVVCGFLILLLIVCGTAAIYIRSKVKKINYSDGVGGNENATHIYDENEEADPQFANMADPDESGSVKELLKAWATNGGDHLYSKNVINIMLVGEDSEGGSSRSDSTILLSVNKKTKKIYLTSFLRDSYSYMNIKGQDRYDKTNHAYSWGGPAKLMEVLSNNYKIKIDHFVTINYNSFIKAVDALGGIDVRVTKAEANYMNRTTSIKGFQSGSSVNLDGKHALVFARIRKLDGEEQRTERQRRLIAAVINSVKDSSIADLDNALDTFLPYITTNYRENEVINLATRAITEGWLKYDVVSQVAPSANTKMGFQRYRTYTGNLSVWIVDYIKAAQELQLSIYGQTNIVIDESTHVSAIKLALGKNYGNNDDYNSGYTPGTESYDEPDPEFGSEYYSEPESGYDYSEPESGYDYSEPESGSEGYSDPDGSDIDPSNGEEETTKKHNFWPWGPDNGEEESTTGSNGEENTSSADSGEDTPPQDGGEDATSPVEEVATQAQQE